MIFSSVLFMSIFLPLTLACYFIAPRKLRNVVLFIASLIFYAWGEPIYFLIMIFSTVLDYSCGKGIEKHEGNDKMRKVYLLISMTVNLGLLCFFKYSDFLIGNINSFLGLNIPLLKLPLPIGISFYTFQTMSYTIDVYRRKVPVQNNILSFGCYVTMFPQLIAGPIVRYIDVVAEIDDRKETWDDFGEGIYIFMIGLGKKVLLANSIGSLWDTILATYTSCNSMSVLMYWLGIFAFAFQLYFDFSGYSDMATGLGRMFGFKFPANFRYPYMSLSVSEFWRRWHITLGTWFKEYVYIPLGGNRGTKWQWGRNVAIVWFLTGLWHGANWNFIAWGLYFGALLAFEKLVLNKYLVKWPVIFRWLYTIVAVLISWCLFAIEDLSLAISYIGGLFGIGSVGLISTQALYLLANYGFLFVVLCIAATPIYPYLIKKYGDKGWFDVCKLVISCLILIISMAYLVDAGYNPFLYFRF